MNLNFEAAKELTAAVKDILAAEVILAKIMSRQKKLLDVWIASPEGKQAISRGAVSYSSLPADLIEAIEKAHMHENLETDVERYLDDAVMKARYGSDRTGAYPDSAPTEQERKKWREQAEDRRRKEGIRPRKADIASLILKDLEQGMKAITRSRIKLLTETLDAEDVQRMLSYATTMFREIPRLISMCQRELRQPEVEVKELLDAELVASEVSRAVKERGI